MSLVLLESLSLPGDPAKPNEDCFAHADHAALVMDGATPLGDPLMPGPSDAQWLAQFGARRLMAHLNDGDAPRIALSHALEDTEKSFTALSRHRIREKWETPCASLILAAESKAGLECFWFGDCSALLLHDGACRVIGDAFDKRGQERDWARKIVQERKLSPSADFNRPKINDLQRASRNRINSGAYWLFSPNPRAASHVAHAEVKAAAGDLLLLASDGLLALTTDYGAYDARGLITAARDRGLAALGQELRAIENDDAMGEKFARFKKSDDSTALLLKIR
jgi:serine/threonine protein phosphatase PrpC